MEDQFGLWLIVYCLWKTVASLGLWLIVDSLWKTVARFQVTATIKLITAPHSTIILITDY